MKKIIALHLPQYYEFEQNNKWWGKGFTEWTHVRGAKPLFKNHNQPRVPLNKNYYNLLQKDNIAWQCSTAKEYGIYGFCFYHYWFEGVQMMEKPVEILRDNSDIDFNYCFSWANHTWTKAPGKKNKKVLIEQTYGDKVDWKLHFDYLCTFFRDNRYIKIENKPVLVIYDVGNIEDWHEMKSYWNELCKNEGWDGIYIVATLKHEKDIEYSIEQKCDAQFEYQPTFGLRKKKKIDYSLFFQLRYTVFNLKIYNKICKFNYNKVWKMVLKNNIANKTNVKNFSGAFSDWDASPRWKHKSFCLKNSSIENFKINFKKCLEQSNEDFIFFTAWNEWSEGAYLEPDELNGYGYLETIKELINEGTSNI